MSRPKKRRQICHAEVAARLRNQPDVWGEVGEYPGLKSAEDVVRRIRTARQAPMYQPAGSFEARIAGTELYTLVFARYVGHTAAVQVLDERPATPPATHIPSGRDCDRVLGQIARGEVQAGPEGARRIAARHQEAYGNAVWGPGPDPDAAWADALAGLSTGGAE
ncbi:hypothetical protein ACIQCF_07610 [Streptomyces sp. NPDC088353]|uniref:hypothetical protein n=1 Tax=Streptomyces sp. NPDC088353 TaxID=3365855 RepID=UPI00380E8E32